MSVARQCANCGTPVVPGAQFCTGCGAAFVTTMVKRRRPFYQVILIADQPDPGGKANAPQSGQVLDRINASFMVTMR